jgi:hypothetical protein
VKCRKQFNKNSSRLCMQIKQSTTWQVIQMFGKIPILPASPVSTKQRFIQQQKTLEDQVHLQGALNDELLLFVRTKLPPRRPSMQGRLINNAYYIRRQGNVVILHAIIAERMKSLSVVECFYRTWARATKGGKTYSVSSKLALCTNAYFKVKVIHCD